MGTNSFKWYAAIEQGPMGHKLEHRKIHTNILTTLLLDLKVLEQAAQRDCGVSFSGDI